MGQSGRGRAALGWAWDWNEPDMSRQDREIDALARRIAKAIGDHDEDTTRRIIADGGGLLAEYPGIASDLLNCAVEHGLAETTMALLEAGAAPDEIDGNGGTPLMAAAWDGHLEVASLLLDAGADPDVLAEHNADNCDSEWFGRCALFFAMVKGHRPLVDLLEPVTHPEVRELAARAAQAEAERQAAEPPPEPSEYQELFGAIVADDPAAVSAALAAGANVNGRDNKGTSPLWLAAAGCRVHALPVLLEHGAEVDAPGEKFGTTPLTVAVRLKRFAVLVPLLAAGANPDRPGGDGMTAWQMARINPRDDSRLEALRRAYEETRRTDRPVAEGGAGTAWSEHA